MALSTAIFVGDTKSWIPELVQRAQSLKVAPSPALPLLALPLVLPRPSLPHP